MRILFTGSSSFTGFWFAKTLINEGFELTLTHTFQEINNYGSLKTKRIKRLMSSASNIFGCKFGDSKFIDLISSSNFDIICHHGSFVKDYKQLNFDIIKAVEENTYNSLEVFNKFKETGGRGFIFTGSVFENSEGQGSCDKAFSPYGVSKSLSYEILKYYSELTEISLGKFVIPNPFGPYEKASFTNYLVKTWFEKKTPVIKNPDYVRDNIHVDLLALFYLDFVKKICLQNNAQMKVNPSGYIGTQLDFVTKFSKEISKRINLECNFSKDVQTDFSEPMKRINLDSHESFSFSWNEEQAWDCLASYYKNLYSYE